MIKDTFLISYLQGKWRMFAFEKIWIITEPDTVNKLCIPCISSMWKYSLSLSLCMFIGCQVFKHLAFEIQRKKFTVSMPSTWLMQRKLFMKMNCFCDAVDRPKGCSLISSREHYQRSSPSQISDMLRAGLETAQKLSSDLFIYYLFIYFPFI